MPLPTPLLYFLNFLDKITPSSWTSPLYCSSSPSLHLTRSFGTTACAVLSDAPNSNGRCARLDPIREQQGGIASDGIWVFVFVVVFKQQTSPSKLIRWSLHLQASSPWQPAATYWASIRSSAPSRRRRRPQRQAAPSAAALDPGLCIVSTAARRRGSPCRRCSTPLFLASCRASRSIKRPCHLSWIDLEQQQHEQRKMTGRMREEREVEDEGVFVQCM